MKLESNAAHIPKQNSENDESELWNRYPNLVNYRKQYCDDCVKDCEFPSMEVLNCMLEKLSNRKGVKK